MRLKRKTKFILTLAAALAIVFIALALYLYIAPFHWSTQDILDTKEVALNSAQPVVAAKQGYPFALKRAKEWRKDAFLSDILVELIGKGQVLGKKEGRIQYGFSVINKDWYGMPYAVCDVDIDIKKQKITRFEAYGGYDLAHPRLRFDEVKIDSDKALEIALSNGGQEFMEKHPNAKVYVSSIGDKGDWSVDFHKKAESYAVPELYFIVDAQTGEIIKDYNERH